MLFGGSRNKNDTNKSTLKITIQVNVESIQCYLGGGSRNKNDTNKSTLKITIQVKYTMLFGGSRNKNNTNKSTLKITIQVNVESIQCYLGGLETKMIPISQH